MKDFIKHFRIAKIHIYISTQKLKKHGILPLIERPPQASNQN